MATDSMAGGRFDLVRRPILVKWIFLAAVAALLAFAGPYGSFTAMDLPGRVLFWFALVFGTDLVAHPVAQGLRHLLLPLGWPPLAPRLLAAGIAALPTAWAGTWLWDAITRPGQNGGFGPRPGFFAVYGEALLLIVAITLVLGLLSYALTGRRTLPAAPAAEPVVRGADDGAAAETAFLRRAGSRHAGARLLAVQAEDHYLRIHTGDGDDLVLMRLRDAVAALAAVPGLQVHRSHWVAAAAVARVERQGQTARLVLRNGLALPVGRTYMAALRAAGWLDRPGSPQP